jgi:hypothetical protein
MTHETLNRTTDKIRLRPLRFIYPTAPLLFCFAFMGCSSIGKMLPNSVSEKQPAAIQDTASLKPAEFDIKIRENEAALTDGKYSPDVALYNIGVLSLNLANPKKDLGKALLAFKRLVSEYPHTPHVEASRAWIQVLDERQTLAKERRMLVRERENLSKEREKLKYVIDKSGQIDLEIEKKRRQTRTK